MEYKKTPVVSFIKKSRQGCIVVLKSLKFIWHHKKLLFFPLLTATLIAGTIGMYDVVYYQLYHKHITSFFPEKKRSNRSRTQPLSDANEVAQNEDKGSQPSPNVYSEHVNEQAENHAALYDAQHAEHSDAHKNSARGSEHSPEFTLFSLIITFLSIFFFAFSNVALSYTASQAFTGSSIRLSESMMHSIKRLPTIFMWTISAFVIHILVNLFTGKNENGKSSFLGRLIGEAIALSWYVATFLVIPVLAHENIGALRSIKRSAHLMKKTFGENIVAALLLPQLIGILLFLWLFIATGIAYATLFIATSLFLAVGLPLIGVLLIITGILCTAVSAATTVFKTAAYHYAVGNPVGPFNEHELKASFKPNHTA